MKKIQLFSLLLFFSAIHLAAAPRSAEEAWHLAKDFFAGHNLKTRNFTATSVVLAATSLDIENRQTRSLETPAYYVYNQNQTGFVIISGDDRMAPVLGYSFENEFNQSSLPENMRFWLTLYTLKQQTLNAEPVSTTPIVSYNSGNFASSVSPLLGDIRYDQGNPYNRNCPEWNGKKCVTGCVATAMATILSYYRYPEQGWGSNSYTTPNHKIQLSMNFSKTTFDWDNILPQYTNNNYTGKQADAVAELMLACGIACNMDYDPGASGADNYRGHNALIKHFGFNPYSYRAMSSFYTQEEWMNLIKTELNAKRPIFYTASDNSLSGHAFVIDGYDEDGLVHVDWGWSGLSNGYFLITNLQPGASSTGGGNGSGYQFEQTMSVNLAPKTMLSVPESYFEMGALEINTSANTARANAIYNRSALFNGTAAIIADNGSRQLVISNVYQLQNLDITYGYTALDFNLQIPSELADDVYDIYVGTQLDNNDHWDRARSEYGSSAEHYLIVENGKARINSETDISLMPEISIEPNNTLRSGRKGEFTLTIKNIRKEHDFIGHIELAVYDQNQNMLTSTRVEQIYIKPGDSKTIICSATMPNTTGKAYICPIWLHNYTRYAMGNLKEITIASQGTPAQDLKLNTCSLENKTVEQGTPFICNGEVTTSGTGDYYDAQIIAYLFNPRTQKYDSQSPFMNIICDKGKTKTFRIEVSSNVSPGTYQYQLYAYNQEKAYPFSLLWSSQVSITQPTGITAPTSRKEFHVSRTASDISLESDKPIARINIYNLQGSLLKTYPCNPSQDTYTIRPDYLSTGIYIIQALHTDGTYTQTKFMY